LNSGMLLFLERPFLYFTTLFRLHWLYDEWKDDYES
jgi:hypothetical protein